MGPEDFLSPRFKLGCDGDGLRPDGIVKIRRSVFIGGGEPLVDCRGFSLGGVLSFCPTSPRLVPLHAPCRCKSRAAFAEDTLMMGCS